MFLALVSSFFFFLNNERFWEGENKFFKKQAYVHFENLKLNCSMYELSYSG